MMVKNTKEKKGPKWKVKPKKEGPNRTIETKKEKKSPDKCDRNLKKFKGIRTIQKKKSNRWWLFFFVIRLKVQNSKISKETTRGGHCFCRPNATKLFYDDDDDDDKEEEEELCLSPSFSDEQPSSKVLFTFSTLTLHIFILLLFFVSLVLELGFY